MADFRETARERMKGFCRVCPVCDGRACAGEVPGMGGLGTGSSFKANVDALARLTFNLRTIHAAAEPDTRAELLGMSLAMPVLAAPIGGVSFNMGGKVTEEEYISAVLAGCKAEGLVGCSGDGVPAFISEAGFAAVKALDGWGIPFVKPWEDAELYAKLAKAKDTGAAAVGMDIDAAGLITLKKMGRPVGPKTPDKLREIIAKAGMKFILKGIMTPAEAHLAVEVGADAIVVSNHGGRVLDSTPGTAEVLPAVAEAAQGRIPVLVDGGVRTGGDVLKMLALGADAVLVGRPFAIAAVGGLEEGVRACAQKLRGELEAAMVLTGTPSLAEINPHILHGMK
jgi:isopentenyl diphosphate isomerase/L-lactate dehydrogenase-like FMN-dependent dehydrogenase